MKGDTSLDNALVNEQINVDNSQANIANEYQNKWYSGTIGKYAATFVFLGTLVVLNSGCHLTEKHVPKNKFEKMLWGPLIEKKESQLYLKQPNIQSKEYLV